MKCEVCGKKIDRCDNCGTELVEGGYICIIDSIYHFHSKRCAEEWFDDPELTCH